MLAAWGPGDPGYNQLSRSRFDQPAPLKKVRADGLDVSRHPRPTQLTEGLEIGRPEVGGERSAHLLGRVHLAGGDPSAEHLRGHVDQDDVTGAHKLVRYGLDRSGPGDAR